MALRPKFADLCSGESDYVLAIKESTSILFSRIRSNGQDEVSEVSGTNFKEELTFRAV